MDESYRKIVENALGNPNVSFAGNPLASEALIAIASDKDAPNAGLAIHELGKLRNSVAVMPLIDILNDSERPWPYRGSAAEALGRIGDPRATDALVEALADERLAHNAADSLAALPTARAVEGMIRGIGSEECRFWVLSALKTMTGDYAFEPLAAAMDHPDPIVRETLVTLIGKIDADRAVPLLCITLKKDPHPSIRGIAAQTLADIKNPQAVENLIAALSDSDTSVSRRVQESLERLTGKLFLFGGHDPKKWTKWWQSKGKVRVTKHS